METKMCTRCETSKSLDQFNKNSSRPDGLQIYCRSCNNQTSAKHYADNPAPYKARAKALSDKKKQFILDGKNVPCADCGKRFIPEAMDYDHVRGEKLFNLSTKTAQSRSMKVIRAEMAKCDVVDATCHRIRTFNRRNLR